MAAIIRQHEAVVARLPTYQPYLDAMLDGDYGIQTHLQ